MRRIRARAVVALLLTLRWVTPLLVAQEPARHAVTYAPPPANQALGLEAVAAVGFTVSDMDRAIEFYCGVLGFEKESDVEVVGAEWEKLTGVFGARIRIVRLRLGQERLELTQFIAPEGRPYPVDTRSNDHWFQHVAIVVRDMDEAYRVLRAHKVRHASTGPQLLPSSNPNAGGIRAFYFKDPDGHHLEVIWFPPGKGDPRWARSHDRLFMGIDHTAIVVSDTERSLRFYRDLLGFRVAGESRNYGTEQAHLNNVEGASLRITALRAPAGPGVEFLEYLAPRDGRAYPADARPNDLLHWQTTLIVAPGEGLGVISSAGAPLVSRGVARPVEAGVGYSRGVVIRDPDGHAIQLIQK